MRRFLNIKIFKPALRQSIFRTSSTVINTIKYASTNAIKYTKTDSKYTNGFPIILSGLFIHASDDSKNESEDSFVKLLDGYIKKYYGNITLPEPIVRQLAWLQTNSVSTTESSVRLADKPEEIINIEIKRCLARWNCLHLLFEGSKEAYEKFIVSQSEDEKLSFSSFQKLSGYFAGLSTAEKEAVGASCFLAISDKAREAAAKVNAKISFDSEKGLSDIMYQCPQILPIFSLLSEEAQKLIPLIYMPDTHARHMLYTEGGNNMFAVLEEKIRSSHFNDQEFKLWKCRWLDNIAGFRGHEDARGSKYLTEKTAQAFFDLNDELDKFRNNPNHDPLKGYLQKRAEKLGVRSLYAAHLGAQMRIYNANEGRAKALREWHNALPPFVKTQYEQEYRILCETLKTTPTYTPAVMDNLDALGCTFKETLDISTQIFSKGFRAAQEQKIAENVPICFRAIADKTTLKDIVQTYHKVGRIPELTVDQKGNIILKAPMPKEQLENTGTTPKM